jgi:hypothetical protein
MKWQQSHGIVTPMSRRGALIGALAATAAFPAQAASAAGAVEALRGGGYAIGATARRELALASQVLVGDLVGTGADSLLGLALGPATRVRLGAEARLKIDRFILKAGGTLVLERGGMLFEHDSKAGAIDLNVRAPFGVIAVRGTRFFAGPSNGVFGVFVQHGAVSLSGSGGEVRVEAGFGADIAAAGARPSAPVRWGAARIAAAMALVGIP